MSTRWRLGLYFAILGVLVGFVTWGTTASSQATANATATTMLAHGGGRLMAADPHGGYWTVTDVGLITSHGGAPTFGSPALSGIRLSDPIVGMEATVDGQGYWLVASDGGVFSYGDAKFYGSTGAIHLNQPVVGMAATSDGQGYWLVASDGGIFSFGDAQFYGSTGAIHLNQPVVGMAATPDGQGYWLVASDGGIFCFGDAQFYGSTGAIHLNQPVIALAATPDGQGYWLVASDGGIFSFGDAHFYGSLGGGSNDVTGMIVNPQIAGYTLVETDGSAAQLPRPTVVTSQQLVTVHSLLKGAYVGAANPSRLAAFAAATGTPTTIASDYLPAHNGWAGMDGSDGSLSWMFAKGWTGSPYTLSLGVPIIPTNSAGRAVGTLAIGATGAYDTHFVTLAQTLVTAGESNAYLRLGYEFDTGSSAWGATTPAEEASYAMYFERIVTAMRSVRGERFKFVWNPDLRVFNPANRFPYDVALAYPGNAYVDYIGVDAYDETWAKPKTSTNAWKKTILPALIAVHQFAAARDKSLAIPEWGVAFLPNGHGLGDDPLYIKNFAAWMKDPSNGVAYESIFDHTGIGGMNANITGRDFPSSLKAFRAEMA
jgi:hypothetical protein